MLTRLISRSVVRSLVGAQRARAFTPSIAATVRTLSSAKSMPSAVTNELVSALNEEIDAEKHLEKENLGGASAPSIPGFQLVTKDAEVRLTKKHGNEDILVVFNVNHSVDIDEDIEQSDAAPVPVALPPFTIEITKGAERFCFQMLLTETEESGMYDYRVEEFFVAQAAKNAADEDVDAYVYSSSGKYVDQSLYDLLFDKYLAERGFTPEFCNQLVTYATHYEHSCYVNLLAKMRDFIKG